MSSEVFHQFTRQRVRQVIVNGNVEPIQVFVYGQSYTVPGMHEVKKPTGAHDDCPSLEFEGVYVPGTMVLTDLHDADNRPIFSAVEAAKVILDIGPTGRANSNWYNRGLTLLPPSARTREEVEKARESAKRRAIVWRIQQARELVQSVDRRNEKLEKQGLPAIPGGPEYTSAIRLLSMEADQEKEIHKQLLADEGSIEPLEPIEENPEEDAEILAFIQSKVEAAAPSKTSDEKAILVEKLLKDPEALKMLDKLRKRRKAFGDGASL